MSIEYKLGDIFDHYEDYDIIIHNCNCHCNWGKGFALTARTHLKRTYIADLNTVKGSPKKLATCSVGIEDNGVIGINCYGQYNYGKQHENFLMATLEDCFSWIAHMYPNKTICCPMLGAGLSGGNWEKIESLLITRFPKNHITIFKLEK